MSSFQSFLEGAIASVAAGCATHPLDLVKVRMQLRGSNQTSSSSFTAATNPAFALHPQGLHRFPSSSSSSVASSARGPLAMAAQIVRSEGILALFSGVSATVLRQALYSSTRLAIYESLTRPTPNNNNNNNNNIESRRSRSNNVDMNDDDADDDGIGNGGGVDSLLATRESNNSTGLMKRIGAGMVAGGVGAAIGNPADLALVRMQADGRLPAHLRRNYSGVGNALFTILDQEGARALWRGSSLTIQRAMAVTSAQLATYDEAKQRLLRSSPAIRDEMPLHVLASFVAGLVAAAVSNPIDVIKTRVMNMNMNMQCGSRHASSCIALDCLVQTVKSEGFVALYKGFTPTVMRQGPYTVVLFVTLEQVRKLFGHPPSSS